MSADGRLAFGTDGLRGRVGEPPITPDFALRLGWATGRMLSEAGALNDVGRVVIGKDTRISGYMLETALQAGLVAASTDVLLLGPVPTPAVAWLTRSLHADIGIVISASHNSYLDNGLKFFDAEGQKLSHSQQSRLLAWCEQPMSTCGAEQLGKPKRIGDAARRYIEFCKRTVPVDFSLSGLRIALDCAHGAAYHIAPMVFQELGAEVVCIGVEPDGLNINDGVGATAPELLARTVLERRADLGIAFDGDADRVLFVDHLGQLVDGDELLYVIAKYQLEHGRGCAGVVGTVLTNRGVELALGRLGIGFDRAAVGDRHVSALMRQRDWHLGGETCGHIICAEATSTGDGIVAALQVLYALRNGKPLASRVAELEKYPQIRRDVHMDSALADAVPSDPVLERALENARKTLGQDGRVVLRPSGTEPCLRLLVESLDAEVVERVADQLAAAVTAASSRAGARAPAGAASAGEGG